MGNPKTLNLKAAKATKKEINALCNFLNVIEEYLTCGTVEYEDCNGESVEERPNPERFIEILSQLWIGDWIRRETAVGTSWNRIVFGYITLLENACNPESDFLEWREDIQEFLDSK